MFLKFLLKIINSVLAEFSMKIMGAKIANSDGNTKTAWMTSIGYYFIFRINCQKWHRMNTQKRIECFSLFSPLSDFVSIVMWVT